MFNSSGKTVLGVLTLMLLAGALCAAPPAADKSKEEKKEKEKAPKKEKIGERGQPVFHADEASLFGSRDLSLRSDGSATDWEKSVDNEAEGDAGEADILDRIRAVTKSADEEAENAKQGVAVKGDVVWRTLTNMQKADFYFANQNYLLAERFYVRSLEKSKSEKEQKKALISLAEVYFAREKPIKAINILEESLDKYPTLHSDPEFVYRLAEFYRVAEMRLESIELFYKVINTIVVGNSQNLDEFIDLARLAKFQIARLFYEGGDYEKAFGAFSRIDLLQMTEDNHEIVMYYKVLASLKAAKPSVGKELIEEFLERFPWSEYTPELMYLRAEILMGMGEVEDGSRQLLELLDYVEADEVFSAEWIFWRQQAGNRLANRYYAEGDFLMALRIYQGVVSLNEEPSWRLPIVYQMSLCFEKLNMYERARESYTFLLEDLALITPDQMTPVLEQLKSSAEWRLKVLTWKEDAESDAASLLNETVES